MEETSLKGRQIDAYVIGEPLGSGAAGVVYAARKDDQLVAVKVIKPGISWALDRFNRESESLRLISHPNVVGYVGHGRTDDGLYYLILEFVDGTSLGSILKERRKNASGPLPFSIVLSMAIQTARGLVAVHDAGFVHRDVKPDNLLVDRCGNVKLCDFNLVKQMRDSNASGEDETREGIGMGTPQYMPPEQCTNAKSAREPADVYSWAATFYHAFAGRKAFDAKDDMDLLLKVLAERPQHIQEIHPDLPSDIADLIMRCLEKAPADRPTFEKVLRVLEAHVVVQAEETPLEVEPEGAAEAAIEPSKATATAGSAGRLDTIEAAAVAPPSRHSKSSVLRPAHALAAVACLILLIGLVFVISRPPRTSVQAVASTTETASAPVAPLVEATKPPSPLPAESSLPDAGAQTVPKDPPPVPAREPETPKPIAPPSAQPKPSAAVTHKPPPLATSQTAPMTAPPTPTAAPHRLFGSED
jgi:serine/threonine-protein kinase